MSLFLWLLACSGGALRYPQVTAGLMAALDQDGDGQVSEGEYTALARPNEPIAACDADGDHTLSAPEVEACFLSLNPTQIQANHRQQSESNPPRRPGSRP